MQDINKKKGATHVGNQNVRKTAFSLSEVLITLAIIGVIAAVTLPTLIQNYKKRVVEVRLQQTWSMLNNAINMAKVEHGDIENWNFNLNTKEFVEAYLLDTLNKQKATHSASYQAGGFVGTYNLVLSNGTKMAFEHIKNYADNSYRFLKIDFDINGNQKPNKYGEDKFVFYLVSKGANIYNAGKGDIMRYIPRAGLYYSGYGVSNNKLKTDYYFGCSKDKILNAQGNSFSTQGYHCTALIAKNNWKIPDDYPKKF